MSKPFSLRTGAPLVAVAMLMMLFVSLRAQQPPARGAQPATPAPATPAPTTPATPAAPAGRGAAPAAPAPKPLVPVATNTITANPDAFYGQAVTITASIEQIFTKSSFTVDQRRVGDAPAPSSRPTCWCWSRTFSARSISRATSR